MKRKEKVPHLLGSPPYTDPTLLFTSSFSSLLFPPTLGEDIQKDVPAPRISCPKGSKAYASHCYALFMTPKSWMDADMACQKRPSGHLVSVLSGAEASFVASLVKNSVNTYPNIWIGLHDPTEVWTHLLFITLNALERGKGGLYSSSAAEFSGSPLSPAEVNLPPVMLVYNLHVRPCNSVL
uniref:C-type lectin domain-containing protein n=1 Tax=Ailuropoda melanoleuca TaxID=9646 RepID=G1MBC5_AILME